MARIDYGKLLQNISIDDVAKRLGMELRAETPNRFKALCPFHDDKTPSLLIDASRNEGPQHFHCFACGAHGDAIDLVKEVLHLGYKEAVEWLAPGAVSDSGAKRRSRAVKKDVAAPSVVGLETGYSMYKAGASIAEFDAWIARRNLDPEVLRRAGFVFASKNYLSRCLDAETDISSRREIAGALEDAYLVRKLFPGVGAALHLPLNAGNSATTRYGDFFIDERIVFPILDEKKSLVGLGGRAYDEQQTSTSPKYQFTRGFPKATVLYRAGYAFAQVRSDAKLGRKDLQVFLCEGFLDALRLESIGLPAVAVMGSSISDQQIQLLKSLRESFTAKDATLTVVVCFDRDEAGLRGASDTCLKLINASFSECKFAWPTAENLESFGQNTQAKDSNDYLVGLSNEKAVELVALSCRAPILAVLAYAFGSTAEDTLIDESWKNAPRSRRLRALSRASSQIRRAIGKDADAFIRSSIVPNDSKPQLLALGDWIRLLDESASGDHRSLSEEFLNDASARLNHSRILAYMGSQRGELPCDEPRWERLDIAATAFNTLLVDRLGSSHAEPIGSYNAVWVPRSFGGSEHRLKMMPQPEDLIIQQYLLNEILTERWDHSAFSDSTFSRVVPAVRYYREERRTVTTGFDLKENGSWGELNSRTLSFAYQIDMDVLEGRQPASDQGMYRPFSECWRDFMKAVSAQATDIGYVYSIRLDAKRYYDRLRRYVVRDCMLSRLQSAIASVTDGTPGFAELLDFSGTSKSSAEKAATVLDRLDEQLFGVNYRDPETGYDGITDAVMGIPQGPVLSAWIGTVALFPVDEVANRFFETYNTDRVRVGYARYVDDIVLLADSPSILAEMRDAIDRCARNLKLTLVAKADEIPPMSAEEFSTYINQGRALAASGPAWEPPLVGDGETGWGFWSVAPTTDRQSALQLLHNVELYKASPAVLLQTVKTAFQAPDLRTSELSKAARLIWYALACEHHGQPDSIDAAMVWERFRQLWTESTQGTSWRLQPEKNSWESPTLFALEGLERLLDTKVRDVAELTAEENSERRKRIVWLAGLCLLPKFDSREFDSTPGPRFQLDARFKLIRWKAVRVAGQKKESNSRTSVERSNLVQSWEPFEWMHEAVSLLSEANEHDDLLSPFVTPVSDQSRQGKMQGTAAELFRALLPQEVASINDAPEDHTLPARLVAGVALQTLVSTVPRNQLLNYLNRRPRLLWDVPADGGDRLVLPPLPGIKISRIFSCLLGDNFEDSIVVAKAIQAIEIGTEESTLPLPSFSGADSTSEIRRLTTNWTRRDIPGASGALQRLDADLANDEFLRLRERIRVADQDVSADQLRQAAQLFRAIAGVVLHFARDNEDLELVPAWPYIAVSVDEQTCFLIGDGVSRSELGSRAFVRDGGRALRTVEVPIFEANLWRVGIAVTDYLGMYDDVAKFSGAETDVVLDAVALSNPARYVLRTQLRKLRGAYADSRIGKTSSREGILPASVERSLKLLETFPSDSDDHLGKLIHVLTTESESAAMFLSIQEKWECSDITSFLKALVGRVVARLPLSVAKELATEADDEGKLRRDFAGVLAFSRRLFITGQNVEIATVPAWQALRAGTVCMGISVAFDGVIASLRSHGDFERYSSFDFPADWDIPATGPAPIEAAAGSALSQVRPRISLVEQLRSLIQHLGHRISPDGSLQDRLSDELIGSLRTISRSVAQLEAHGSGVGTILDWPFAVLSNKAFELLTIELLDHVAVAVKQLDLELGLEVVLVQEQSYGFNAQTRRFTDSRNGVYDVTPWMISQFPRNAKHVEEVSCDGRFRRIWSEVFDRQTGKLLSISTLGEPFASIALTKVIVVASGTKEIDTIEENASVKSAVEASDVHELSETARVDIEATNVRVSPSRDIAEQADQEVRTSLARDNGHSVQSDDDSPNSVPVDTASSASMRMYANAFRKYQREAWASRGNRSSKQDGHVRVALLQSINDITYRHPLVETCPSSWPFSSDLKKSIAEFLKSHKTYGPLQNATRRSGAAHLWTGSIQEIEVLPSWSEHRRRAVLKRVIDSCVALNVDLIVLPEYSVRPETIIWLKEYIANKGIAILAGTFMEFRKELALKHLTAQMTLLWPVPKEVTGLLATSRQNEPDNNEEIDDFLRRGAVLEFSRNKKYRSIALEEFFRPPAGTLAPLFRPGDLAQALAKAIGFKPSGDAMSHLLTQTRLPLKHLLELICSEIFLVSSPANYRHMNDDYRTMRGRFGEGAEEEEVFADVRELAKLLSLTGDGIGPRRSILAVPAATSRSADYWIAGQASFLAAGTTSVFCNSVGSKELVGGSCFIGRGSWKTTAGATGYISNVTPYHGWSKGIFYNSSNDALSDRDQAVVVADIDPYNMLEGKPRAQTMPSPLQLVAYLPVVESVDWGRTEENLLRALSISRSSLPKSAPAKPKVNDEAEFWQKVQAARAKPDDESLLALWEKFSDPGALLSRAQTAKENGSMQPTAPLGADGMFSCPAYYDWIDVSLTLTEQEKLPTIAVPPWTHE